MVRERLRAALAIQKMNLFTREGTSFVVYEPDVSLPTFPAARLALVAMPELEPPVGSAGRPSLNG